MSHSYASEWETEAANELEKEGWNLTKRGWPDFLCWREFNGEKQLICVEVKGPNDELSPAQITVHGLLWAAGIPVYVVHSAEETHHFDKAKTLELLSRSFHDALDIHAKRLEKSMTNVLASFEQGKNNLITSHDLRVATCRKKAEELLSTFSYCKGVCTNSKDSQRSIL